MAIAERLRSFLSASGAPYTVTAHPAAYTAQELAAAQHVPGRAFAKSVLVLTNQGPALVVLPAVHRINFSKLKTALRAKSATLANETQVRAQFPDVEAGAMSPFGNLYRVAVIVERSLGASAEIVFNGGTHTDTVRMGYRKFEQLVKPSLGTFGEPFPNKKPAKRSPAKRTVKRPRRTPRAKTARRAPARHARAAASRKPRR